MFNHLYFRYATYNDDVAVEVAPKPAAADDDDDESFDMKNYDITYDEALAASSSDDELPKADAATAPAADCITDHLGKAQKKTMDM
jgi:hypothetical protein